MCPHTTTHLSSYYYIYTYVSSYYFICASQPPGRVPSWEASRGGGGLRDRPPSIPRAPSSGGGRDRGGFYSPANEVAWNQEGGWMGAEVGWGEGNGGAPPYVGAGSRQSRGSSRSQRSDHTASEWSYYTDRSALKSVSSTAVRNRSKEVGASLHVLQGRMHW